MVDEGPDGIFDWCYGMLKGSEDWDSLSLEARKQLLRRFRTVVSTLAECELSESDIQDLIKATDIITVFEALLSIWSYNRSFKDRYSLLAYLRKVVVSTWKEKVGIADLEKEPKPKGKVGRPRVRKADASFVSKYNPLRSRFCLSCGKLLKKDNLTGFCTRCQKNGANKRNNGASTETSDSST
jgi:hypothetical protein